MESATIQRLRALNLAFYDQHAEAFADSRPRLAPGILRALAPVVPGARVLELGCGDGKVGRWLARQAPPAFYLGLDNSAAMLARARRYTPAGSPPAFNLAELTAEAWTSGLPAAPFDWALAFAVFHHLPGFETRARRLSELAARLASGGQFVMSNWQFLRSARLAQRRAPWSALGLTETEVDPGDYLLTWERGGRRGLRYVHLLAEAEARQLAGLAGLAVTEVFSADGASGALAEYVAMKKV